MSINLEELLVDKKKNSVWDDYVPVVPVEGTNVTNVYLTDGIDIPSEYAKLCYTLGNATSADEFTLHLNTPGGMVDSSFMLIDAIRNSEANVTGYLTGTVASAGTIIALSCDDLKIAPHTAFMIHNYSSGLSGKGHEMKAHQAFVDKNLNEAFRYAYAHFLTEDEMTDIIEGKDLWLNSTEVTERWGRVLKARKSQ